MDRMRISTSKILLKAMILLTIIISLLSGLFFYTNQNIAASSTNENEKSIFLMTDSPSSEGGYFISAAHAEFGPAGMGMTALSNARLIKTDIGEAIYRFDLDNNTTGALLTVVGRFIHLGYSLTQNGTYEKLTPVEMPSMWENHAVTFAYNLSDSNVFTKSNSNKTFYIKITGGVGEYDGWLFAISITSSLNKYTGDVMMAGISATKNLYHQDGLMYGNTTSPSDPKSLCIYVIANGKIAFKLRFDPEVVISISPSYVSNNGDYSQKKRYSLDGIKWNNYVEKSEIAIDKNGWLFFEMENKGADDLILSMNFIATKREIKYLDLASQEKKTFKYTQNLERVHVTPLPDIEKFVEPKKISEPIWFDDSKKISTVITVTLLILVLLISIFMVFYIVKKVQRGISW